MNKDDLDFGKKIKELRLSRSLTQLELAEMLGVTPGFISNIEKGRTLMSVKMLINIARALNVSLDGLIGEVDPAYTETALMNQLMREISKLGVSDQEKLLKTIKLWNRK